MARMTQAEYTAWMAKQALKMLPAERLARGAATPDGKEHGLHAQIKDECQRRGWIALHGSMAHRAHRTVGEPDFVIIANDGRTYLIEAKTRTKKPTTEQRALIAWARKLGHLAAVVRSLTEFLEIIES